MSAGNIQLAAIGQQDAYLTGNPSITYFSGVYKRHTPFVLEAYEIPFIGNKVLYGRTAICKIPLKGDLLRGLTVKMNLPYLNDPGNNWNYPEQAGAEFRPYLNIGLDNGTVTQYNVNFQGVTFYSTYDLTFRDWLTPPETITPTIGNWIDYDTNQNKFYLLNNTASISNVSMSSNIATFWGFDVHNFDYIDATGNLVYVVARHTSNCDLTLEQAGWDRGTGLPPVNNRAGLLASLNMNTPLGTGDQVQYGANTFFMNLISTIWTIEGTSGLMQITPGGCIRFFTNGTYQVKVQIESSGGVLEVGLGSSLQDGHPALDQTIYDQKYKWTVSPDPTMPAILQVKVSDKNRVYYIDVTTDGATPALTSNTTYLAIGPDDEQYTLTSNTPLASKPTFIPFTSLTKFTQSSRDDTILVDASGLFSFVTPGAYLMTCSFSVASSNLEAIAYGTSNTPVRPVTPSYTYKYTTDQCRDPTINFSLPIVAESGKYYYVDLFPKTAPDTLYVSNTFITFCQVAATQAPNESPEFPLNGTLWQANGNFTPTVDYGSNGYPLRLGSSNFVSNGLSNFITTSSEGVMSFSNVGTYYLTTVISTDQKIKSVSIGGNRYNIGVGLSPPYTVHVPFYIENISQTAQINVVSESPLLTTFANTYVSVVPFTANTFSAYNYVDSVGTYAIQQADLVIGGQVIQSITGEAIELWNDLNIPLENQPALKLLTGKGDTSNVYPPGRTYYTNLPFYFYGASELSIPLAALTRQEVEVYITFKEFNELNVAKFKTSQPMDTTIICEYVYLSEPEIQWIQNNRIDYLITQTQIARSTLLPGFTTGLFNLEFTNPVKELFFVIQNSSNGPYNFANNGLVSMALTFNGEEVFTRDATDSLYLGTLVPYNHHIFMPTREFFMYSFASDPSNPKPSGQVNFSRIRHKVLEINMNPSIFSKSLRIYATSYNVLRIENGLAGLLFNV
jgi:hypothetical protein